MKIGIMQPYFFPYLGYFSLIDATDHWVIFDEVQFIRHGWIDRNRVLNSQNELGYIRVSLVKHERTCLINNVYINNTLNWKIKILEQLTCYKRKAPYYKETINFLKEVFSVDFSTILELNIHLLEKICQYIGLPFNYSVYSKMGLNIDDKINHPGQWALEITKNIGGSVYINPIGGKEIFKVDEFKSNNIDLVFCENNLTSYKQFNQAFDPGLSIIDVLMFNSIEDTGKLIKDYKLYNI